MRSPMTMGLEVPGPGSSTFHRRFSPALQVSGGLAPALAARPPEPRNWAQSRLDGDSSVTARPAGKPRAKRIARVSLMALRKGARRRDRAAAIRLAARPAAAATVYPPGGP